MKYRFFLRMKIEDNKWMTMGENHIIPWDIRDLIAASSGWYIINQETEGVASSLVPKLQKGILELTQSSPSYSRFEFTYGMGTIKDVLHFYQELLIDCQQYPFTELCGGIVA